MMNALRSFGNFLKSPLGIALIGPLFAAIVSAPAVWFSYQASIYVQDRQRTIEEIRSLDEANAKLLEAGALFIAAINTSNNLSIARDKITTLLAQQIISSVAFRSKLRPVDLVYAKEYEEALKELNSVSKSVSSPTEMRAWAEAFGRVLDTKSRLSQVVNLGVGKKA